MAAEEEQQQNALTGHVRARDDEPEAHGPAAAVRVVTARQSAGMQPDFRSALLGSTYAQNLDQELSDKSLELQQELKRRTRRLHKAVATSKALHADLATGIVPHRVSHSTKLIQPMLPAGISDAACVEKLKKLQHDYMHACSMVLIEAQTAAIEQLEATVSEFRTQTAPDALTSLLMPQSPAQHTAATQLCASC